MPNNKRILFIDDELVPEAREPGGNYMFFYILALRENGFEVVETLGPDDALKELQKPDAHFDLIILDIMMPPGKCFARKDTDEGLRTGVFLADELHRLARKTPILVLTNLANPLTHGELRRKKGVRDVLTKDSCMPFQLVDEIRRILEV
jgi:CheY-like chemotaxis protein